MAEQNLYQPTITAAQFYDRVTTSKRELIVRYQVIDGEIEVIERGYGENNVHKAVQKPADWRDAAGLIVSDPRLRTILDEFWAFDSLG